MAPSRALLSSLPSPCAASLPFPFPLSPLAPAEPPLACGGSREQRAPSGTRRMGRGAGADQLSLHEHRGEHATSIMSFPRIRCALVPRVSSQAAKHTRAPFGVVGPQAALRITGGHIMVKSCGEGGTAGSPSWATLTQGPLREGCATRMGHWRT